MLFVLVTTLLKHWFPTTIDFMGEETALRQGERPGFFYDTKDASILNGTEKVKNINRVFGYFLVIFSVFYYFIFSADQVVLCRDEKTREVIQSLKIESLVLTINEVLRLTLTVTLTVTLDLTVALDLTFTKPNLLELTFTLDLTLTLSLTLTLDLILTRHNHNPRLTQTLDLTL